MTTHPAVVIDSGSASSRPMRDGRLPPTARPANLATMRKSAGWKAKCPLPVTSAAPTEDARTTTQRFYDWAANNENKAP
jgi:hypothetical protein